MTLAHVFDDTNCTLGEGPLWHPLRAQLVWFDILDCCMYVRGPDDARAQRQQFPEIVTAAGWVDGDTLILASETGLWRHSIATGRREMLAPLESGRPETRSNDGRADRQGGFWIGTMQKDESAPEGAIYRWYRGELRQLFSGITVPNAIAFSPDGGLAYWADTPTQRVMRTPLDAQGWPAGESEVFIDLAPEGLFPDGSAVDAAGHYWNAHWGGGQVAEYDASGRFLRALALPAVQCTCPAFIGADLSTLVCTSAARGLFQPGQDRGAQGQTFRLADLGPGLQEPAVIL